MDADIFVSTLPRQSVGRFGVSDSVGLAPIRVPHPIATIAVLQDARPADRMFGCRDEIYTDNASPSPMHAIKRFGVPHVVIVRGSPALDSPFHSRDVPHPPDVVLNQHPGRGSKVRVDLASF